MDYKIIKKEDFLEERAAWRKKMESKKDDPNVVILDMGDDIRCDFCNEELNNEPLITIIDNDTACDDCFNRKYIKELKNENEKLTDEINCYIAEYNIPYEFTEMVMNEISKKYE